MKDIFGYSFEEIQIAQQGGSLGRKVDTSKPLDNPATEEDLALLEKHGSIQALKDIHFYGVVDRLERTYGVGFNPLEIIGGSK